MAQLSDGYSHSTDTSMRVRKGIPVLLFQYSKQKAAALDGHSGKGKSNADLYSA